MEELKNWFVAALPGLEDRLQSVVDELNKIGCRSIANLAFVNFDEDINAVLLPIERRKLKTKLATTGKCFSIHLCNIHKARRHRVKAKVILVQGHIGQSLRRETKPS